MFIEIKKEKGSEKGSSRRLTLLIESLKTSKVKMRPDPFSDLFLTLFSSLVLALLTSNVHEDNQFLISRTRYLRIYYLRRHLSR